jgi:hypothetical protein
MNIIAIKRSRSKVTEASETGAEPLKQRTGSVKD